MTQSPNDMNKALFLNLVTMLSMSVMQHLGKTVNPMTGKTEISLEGAQATIDMLDMLEAKTRGNRDTDEDKVMNDTLTMLKMNYVETKNGKQSAVSGKPSEQKQAVSENKEEKKKEKAQRPEVSGQGKETSGQKDQEKTGNQKEKPETKDPKFHKSYE